MLERILQLYVWKDLQNFYTLLIHLENNGVSIDTFKRFIENNINKKGPVNAKDSFVCPLCGDLLRIGEVNTNERNQIEDKRLKSVIFCPNERECGFQGFSSLSVKEIVKKIIRKEDKEVLNSLEVI